MEIEEYSQSSFDNAFKAIYRQSINNKSSEKSPKAFLLGGQSGAGKSTLYQYIKKNNNSNFIRIDGDTYRSFHPHSDELKEKYGKDDVKYTAKFAGQIVGRLVDKLSDESYNLIVEGTLRTAETPILTAQELKNKGYDIDLLVMAVKPEISYLSTLMRYETSYASSPEQARATPKDHHDLIIDRLPSNLDQVARSNLFSRISLVDRNEDIIYDSNDSEIKPSTAIKDFWSKSWSQDEYDMFKQSLTVTETLRDGRQSLDNLDLNELSRTVDTKIFTQMNGLEQNPEEYNL